LAAERIALRGVTWRRGERTILHDVDWTVRAGEHWAVIGLNGSGKTSLTALVNGYAWPTRGTLEVLGRRLGEAPVAEIRRRIGWVSGAMADEVAALGAERVLDVVVGGRDASIGRWRALGPEDAGEAEAALGRFGADHLADRAFPTLSQGERQRVLLARAFVARPEILILDEPCAGLDLKAREALLASLGAMMAGPQAPTVVYVSHHAEEVLPALTHALLLGEGRVVAAGPKRQVLTSARLSAALEVPVTVRWRGGRPWLAVTASAAEAPLPRASAGR